MLSLRLFTATVLVAVALLVIAQRVLPRDPFDGGDPLGARALDFLSEEDWAAAKLRHGLRSARIEVALFGNSRAVMVSHADIGLSRERFFNFAVPGSSFLQSVVLLEELAHAGKSPGLSLISLDHPATQHFDNPRYPFAPGRWRLGIADVMNGLVTPEVSVREWLRMGWRYLLVEWEHFEAVFSARRLRSRWRDDLDSVSTVYLRDGSRPMNGSPTPVSIAPMQALKPRILTGYLQRAVMRLGALASADHRIVVYESPLAPGILPAEPARWSHVWDSVESACRASYLECLSAPRLGRETHPPYWTDPSHAPGSLLGEWLADVVRRHGVEIH